MLFITFVRTCFLMLLALLMFKPADLQAQQLVTKTSAAAAAASRSKWQTCLIGGIEYMNMDDLWTFYRFSRMKNTVRAGYTTFGYQNRFVCLKAGKMDFYVNNFRYILSYPIRELNGKLMVSTTDVKKLIDPVLRPQFSANSGKITTIVIDPGHGAHDAGAVSAYASEKVCNLQLALRLRDLLVKAGLKVVMTRDTDVFLTLQQRVAIANKYPNSIFVSIHHNSGGSSASGIETFTLAPKGTTSPFAKSRANQELSGNNQDSENIALATAVHSRAIKTSGAIDRGVQRARFSVLCTIQRPAILYEGGFVTNPTEGKLISSAAYQQKMAAALCEGILSYCAIVGGHTGLKQKTTSKSSSSSSSGRINGSSSYTGTTRLR